MAKKIWIIIAVIGAIILVFSLGFLFDSLETNKRYAHYETPKQSFINKTLSITSIRTAEQYANLQKSFPNEAEISACNYDLYKQEKINGKCTLSSVAQQPNSDYIIVCSCVISYHA